MLNLCDQRADHLIHAGSEHLEYLKSSSVNSAPCEEQLELGTNVTIDVVSSFGAHSRLGKPHLLFPTTNAVHHRIFIVHSGCSPVPRARPHSSVVNPQRVTSVSKHLQVALALLPRGLLPLGLASPK